ncbi:MAG: helix-turn-helix transcriptional regulator [Bdellovibrionales bacterium]|nr:helix-turn-helix transcriptional regulator [Bdellovibrionales bacterium]
MNLRRLARVRHARGISQSELANRSRTSLATIQNIEAGRANPSLATLERIVHELGLRLELRNTPPDWGRLASLGLPLLTTQETFVRPEKDLLRQELSTLSTDTLHALVDPREAGAMRAWLSALHDHYPQLWDRLAPHLNQWLEKQKLSGPEIKLRRIALSKLADYL